MEKTPQELSPLEVIALEARMQPFCPVAMEGGQYREDVCRLSFNCTICRDLLIKEAPYGPRPA